MKTPETVLHFAKSNGYDNAKYLGEWNGYTVYEPTFKDNEEDHIVGYPLSILVKDDKITFTTEEECFEVLSYFDNEED